MKKELLSMILLIVCLTISGQQVSKSTNSYRGNDMLEKRLVLSKGLELSSNNSKGIWSLEDAEISKESSLAEYTALTDTLMAVERGDRTYYSQDRGTVRIIGSENYMEQISYDMPETWLQFPMQQGDSVCGYFNGTGKYCDRLFMRRFGTYKTKADETGKMVLPEGDTLRNVIHLHTERYVGCVLAPIDTMKCRIPAFTVDSIVSHLIPDSAKMHEDVYRWYAEGYRYPVLEAMIVRYREKTLTEKMYYCPPEMQELLALDDENKAVRAKLTSSGDSATGNSSGGFRYYMSQNDGNGTVIISYSSDKDIKVTALLSNSQGYVYRRASQSGGSEIKLSYNGLPRGQYIIHITAGTEKFAEKFSVR